jgi:hypothetical protein
MQVQSNIHHIYDLSVENDGQAQTIERSTFHAATDGVMSLKSNIDTFGTFGTAGTFAGSFGCMGTAGCCC